MAKIVRNSVWALAVLLILMASVVTYLRIADLSRYKEQVEGYLSDVIGHELVVDGLFELTFGGTTSLTAEKVRLSNPGWHAEPMIARVEYFSVSIDLWSLLDGPIVVENLRIRGANVRLEKDDSKQANWTTQSAVDKGRSKATTDRDLVAFRDVRVRDARLLYLDPARRRPIDLQLEQLSIRPDESHILDLDLRGAVNDIPIWADGKMGPWQNLLAGRDIVADFEMTLGQVRVSVDGSVEDLVSLDGTELSMSVSGPAIERITDRLGLPPFATGDFAVDGGVKKLDIGSKVRLEGNLGAIFIFASGATDSLTAFNRADLDFSFSGPDTRYIAEVFGVSGAPEIPFFVAGDLQKEGRRFTFSGTRAQLRDNTLRVDGWLDFKGGIPDGEVRINAAGPDISVFGPFARVPGLPAEAFDISGQVQKTGRRVQVDKVSAVVGENRILASGALGGRGSTDTQIAFSAWGPDVSVLGKIAGLQEIEAKPFDAAIVLKSDPIGIRIESAKGDFGEIQLEVEGVVGAAEGLSGTDLRLRANGSDLRHLARLTRLPMLPNGPFDVGVRAGIDRGRLRLSEGEVTVAGLRGAGSGTVAMSAGAGDFDLDLSLSGPDLADAMEMDSLKRWAGEAFAIKGRLNRRQGELDLRSVSARVGDFEINADGELVIDNATGSVTLRVSAPDSNEVKKLLGVDYLPSGIVSAGGRLEKKDNELVITDFSASIGDYWFTADGTLSNVPLSNRSDFQFSGGGPELHELGRVFAYDYFPAKPFRLAGEVNGIPTGFALEGLVARIGDNDLSGVFTVDLRDKPVIVGALDSSFLDLKTPLEREDAETAEQGTTKGGLFFSDTPINAAWLNNANIDVALKTDRLILSYGDLQNFQFSMRLRDGVLDIDPVSFRESDGKVEGRMALAPENGAYALSVFLSIQNMHLGRIASEDQDRATVPRVDGHIELSGTGRSLHEIMASSSGKVTLGQGPGRLRNLITSRMFGDIVLQIIRTLNPLQTAEEYTTLQCANYVVIVTNGLAAIEDFSIQSARMAVIAKGSANLADEKLDVVVRATPREGLGISIGGVANSFFKLGGTLSNPKLQIDPTASVATTGAAVATGGLSIVAKGLWDRVRAQSDICKHREQKNDTQ